MLDRFDGLASGLALSAGVLVFAALLGEATLLALRRWGRRSEVVAGFARRARRPLVGGLLVGAALLVTGGWVQEAWVGPVALCLRLVLVALLAWLVGVLVVAAEDVALRRYDVIARDNRRARRARTQILMLRRLTTAALVMVALSVMLLQFDGARAAGASLLASAGLVSVVAGLAAQTSLANVFAGLQLTLTDSLRVDDVVVVEGEWGNVEEITLVSVVVRIWDSRRLVLPTSYFTTTPFENWTRHEAAVLGSIEIDLDWSVAVQELREEFSSMVGRHDLWDGKVSVMQVTEATGSFVGVRALVSAQDGPSLFDLRCDVREHLVGWLAREQPEALPRVRIGEGGTARNERSGTRPSSSSRVFSGSAEAEARAAEITGPVPRA